MASNVCAAAVAAQDSWRFGYFYFYFA